MADLKSLMFALIRVMAASGESIKVPSRAKVLGGWCLPMLSSALASAEKEQDALELLRSVERLKARQEGTKE